MQRSQSQTPSPVVAPSPRFHPLNPRPRAESGCTGLNYLLCPPSHILGRHRSPAGRPRATTICCCPSESRPHVIGAAKRGPVRTHLLCSRPCRASSRFKVSTGITRADLVRFLLGKGLMRASTTLPRLAGPCEARGPAPTPFLPCRPQNAADGLAN